MYDPIRLSTAFVQSRDAIREVRQYRFTPLDESYRPYAALSAFRSASICVTAKYTRRGMLRKLGPLQNLAICLFDQSTTFAKSCASRRQAALRRPKLFLIR